MANIVNMKNNFYETLNKSEVVFRRCSIKKTVLINFVKFTEKRLQWSSNINKGEPLLQVEK